MQHSGTLKQFESILCNKQTMVVIQTLFNSYEPSRRFWKIFGWTPTLNLYCCPQNNISFWSGWRWVFRKVQEKNKFQALFLEILNLIVSGIYYYRQLMVCFASAWFLQGPSLPVQTEPGADFWPRVFLTCSSQRFSDLFVVMSCSTSPQIHYWFFHYSLKEYVVSLDLLFYLILKNIFCTSSNSNNSIFWLGPVNFSPCIFPRKCSLWSDSMMTNKTMVRRSIANRKSSVHEHSLLKGFLWADVLQLSHDPES